MEIVVHHDKVDVRLPTGFMMSMEKPAYLAIVRRARNFHPTWDGMPEPDRTRKLQQRFAYRDSTLLHVANINGTMRATE